MIGSSVGTVPDYGYPAGTYTNPALFGSTATSASGSIINQSWIVQSFDLNSLGVDPGPASRRSTSNSETTTPRA